MSNTKSVTWDVVKSFTSEFATVDVSASSTTPRRYSYRVTWVDGEKRGPWFPDRNISFLNSIAAVVGEAETWILGERDRELKDYEERLAERRAKENDKRARHQANLEARREANRSEAKGKK